MAINYTDISVSPKRFDDLVSAFSQQTVVTIGDIMVDRYLVGSAKRISAEAPVPVLEVSREYQNLEERLMLRIT